MARSYYFHTYSKSIKILIFILTTYDTMLEANLYVNVQIKNETQSVGDLLYKR